ASEDHLPRSWMSSFESPRSNAVCAAPFLKLCPVKPSCQRPAALSREERMLRSSEREKEPEESRNSGELLGRVSCRRRASSAATGQVEEPVRARRIETPWNWLFFERFRVKLACEGLITTSPSTRLAADVLFGKWSGL